VGSLAVYGEEDVTDAVTWIDIHADGDWTVEIE